MKRYLSFFGDIYYPSPAMGDFVGDFDDQHTAIQACFSACKKRNPPSSAYSTDRERWDGQWACVWDSEARVEVWRRREMYDE